MWWNWSDLSIRNLRRGSLSQAERRNADHGDEREYEREENGAAIQGVEGRKDRVRRQRRRMHRSQFVIERRRTCPRKQHQSAAVVHAGDRGRSVHPPLPSGLEQRQADRRRVRLDRVARSGAKLHHASIVALSSNNTLKLLGKLRLAERLRKLRLTPLGVRLHFSEAGGDNDGKFWPLFFDRIGKLQAGHVWHGVIGDDQIDRALLPEDIERFLAG